VFGVAAASRNTRFEAARCDLTWAGLEPADRASLCWRLPSFDHLVGDGANMVVVAAFDAGCHIAKKFNVVHDQRRLVNDTVHDMQIGATALADDIGRYSGSYDFDL
jgi:hypothetical protein